MAAVRPLQRLHVMALGLTILLGACQGGDDPAAPGGGTSSATAGASSGTRAAVVSTAPTRAIGQPQSGTLPVWLTSFAVLPWTDHVEQAGRHTFTVSNRSQQKHSFAVIRFDGDPRSLPLSAHLIATAQVQVVAQTEVIDPGREVDLALDLPAGRYVLTSLFAQDYAAGMAARFTVGGLAAGNARPKQPPEGVLGVYLLEYGAFASNGQVRGGKTAVRIQNLGTRAREFAVIRWRGAEDALPTRDGAILLDGLQEAHRFEPLQAGEERQVAVDLQGGYSYVFVSLAEGEYEKGIHTQVKVN